MRRIQLKMRLSLLTAALTAGLIAACSGSEPTPEPFGMPGLPNGRQGDRFASMELDDTGRLALGTLLLEETDNAVTSDQAARLLPLWRDLQEDAPTEDAELTEALSAIRQELTSDQLSAIEAMDLDGEDFAAWMRENRDVGNAGPMPDRAGAFADMSEEEREAMRETAEAGGFGGRARGTPPAGQSDEERRSRMEAAEASGTPWSGGPGFGPMEPNAAPIGAVVALLEARADG